MATSGSFNTSIYYGVDSIYPRYGTFSWSRTNYSIEENYSDIGWTFRANGGSLDDRWVGMKERYVTVDGQTWSADTVVNAYNGTLLLSGTKRIYHNNDGTKTFNVSAGIAIFNYGSYNSTGSSNFTLDTIPRQATLESAPDFNDLDNPTITYSNPAGNSVDSLQACISLDTTHDDIEYRDISKTGNSYTFNLTDEERAILRQACTGDSRSIYFFIRTEIGTNTYYSYLEKTFTIINGNYVNINGDFKKAVPYININGTWKRAVPYININETWKKGRY